MLSSPPWRAATDEEHLLLGFSPKTSSDKSGCKWIACEDCTLADQQCVVQTVEVKTTEAKGDLFKVSRCLSCVGECTLAGLWQLCEGELVRPASASPGHVPMPRPHSNWPPRKDYRSVSLIRKLFSDKMRMSSPNKFDTRRSVSRRNSTSKAARKSSSNGIHKSVRLKVGSNLFTPFESPPASPPLNVPRSVTPPAVECGAIVESPSPSPKRRSYSGPNDLTIKDITSGTAQDLVSRLRSVDSSLSQDKYVRWWHDHLEGKDLSKYQGGADYMRFCEAAAAVFLRPLAPQQLPLPDKLPQMVLDIDKMLRTNFSLDERSQ